MQPAPLLLLALALPWLCLSLTGCAGKTTHVPQPLFSESFLEMDFQAGDVSQAIYAYLLSQDLDRAGDFQGARQALRRALKADPSPFLVMELANSYWREGQTVQAREVLKKFIVRFPDERGLAAALVNAYLAETMVDEAITTLDVYLRQHPGDTSMRRELAALLLQYARYSHAADMLLEIPEAERTPEVRLLLARSKAGLGLNRQAMEQLHLALRQDPVFIEALTELAFLHEEQGDFLEAEKTYLRILALQGDAEEVLLRLIQLNVKLNRPENALSLALSHDLREDFTLEAVLIFLRENMFPQAQALLDRIPEGEAPPEADFYRAHIAYDGDRDLEQALAYLARIPEDHVQHSRALNFQGYLLLQLGRLEEALEVARDGQGRFPDQSDFLLLEVEILISLKDEPRASMLLEKAREKWPADTDVLYRLGFLKEQMGRREQAMGIMEDLVALDPDHAEALNFIGYILAEENRDLERALVLIESALKLKPGSGHIIDSLAWVHYRLGNMEEAWKHILSAVEILQDDPTIWEHYGDIALALGMKDQARKGYRNALEFGSKHPDAVRKKLESL